MMPGSASDPDAKYRRSVEARPRSVTSAPEAVAPSASAAASSGEDNRQSRPIRILEAPLHDANAPPMRRAMSTSSSSGTTPRTSYALKMRSRSGDTSPHATGPTSASGLLDDHADHGLQRHVLAVTMPPFRLADVAGREREVAAADRHRDRDEVFGGTVGAAGGM